MRSKKISSIMAYISVFSLTLFGVAMAILLWKFVSNNLYWILGITSFILLLLVIIGKIKWNKIKKKMIKVFS